MSWWALNLFSFQFKAILMSSAKEVRKVPRESRKALLWKCKSSSSYSRQNIKMIPETVNKTFAYLFSLSLLMRKNRLDENTRDCLFVCLCKLGSVRFCQLTSSLPDGRLISIWHIGFNFTNQSSVSQPFWFAAPFLCYITIWRHPWIQFTSKQTSSSEIGGTRRTFQGTQGCRGTPVKIEPMGGCKVKRCKAEKAPSVWPTFVLKFSYIIWVVVLLELSLYMGTFCQTKKSKKPQKAFSS